MPKKSLPKKGKPGLLARTTILKSGWITITFSLPSTLAASEKWNRWFVKLCSKWCQVFLIQLLSTGCGRTYEWHQWGSRSIRNTRKKLHKFENCCAPLLSYPSKSQEKTHGPDSAWSQLLFVQPFLTLVAPFLWYCSLQSKDTGWVLTLENARNPGKGQYSG